MPFLSPDFKEKLREYHLNLLKGRGTVGGSRRSARTGRSLELADFRSYSPGDELKRVDFKAYARLKKLFVKVYEEEEEGNFVILLDRSLSLNFGEPSKFFLSQKVASIIAFLSLNKREKVLFFPLPQNNEKPVYLNHINHYLYFEEHLSHLFPEGKFPSLSEFKYLLESIPFRGGVYFLTDLFLPSEFTSYWGLLKLHSLAFTVIAIQSYEELEPPEIGEVNLRDLEEDDKLSFYFQKESIQLYKERYNHYFLKRADEIIKAGGKCFFLNNQDNEDALFYRLLKEEVIS
ncbi:MAG: hypothetical protein DDT42_01047 [candidate division WS2 bacterium]|uniref:DUF58 domain-containing protein n=1 Tax=Psychracetigena formicireducens TaxID=2986056 RepID=A0A9E2BHV9_PSYF1|nr:hypothetical protein [Candidatus Psychracetigena formicireducens]